MRCFSAPSALSPVPSSAPPLLISSQQLLATCAGCTRCFSGLSARSSAPPSLISSQQQPATCAR
eukprot:14451512-Ditylum_brightwellii.AAC.1